MILQKTIQNYSKSPKFVHDLGQVTIFINLLKLLNKPKIDRRTLDLLIILNGYIKNCAKFERQKIDRTKILRTWTDFTFSALDTQGQNRVRVRKPAPLLGV